MTDSSDFSTTRDRLWQEIASLHSTWSEFDELFGYSPERVRVLNACAATFFGVAHRALLREVILGISRLTDPPRARGNRNLVIGTLLSDPIVDTVPGLKSALAQGVAEAVRLAKPIRSHRHKYIAHLDHATAIGESDSVLPGMTAGMVMQSILAIEQVYKTYALKAYQTDSRFGNAGTLLGARQLADILESSDRWRRVQSIQSGHPQT